jgi:lipoprotein-anchoring transpeptidase ErfK/SrfK
LVHEQAGGGICPACIRMTNYDVMDLYGRARVGAPVVVTH